MALDRTGLAGLAEQHDALIELTRAPGDHVPAGSALVHVYGPRPLPKRRLLRRIVLGDERIIDDDPAFVLRMLVDVGIKALSPAVNDPTTAVQSLDRIEDLLRYVAAKHLSIGIIPDGHGAVRLVYPTPTWDDLVELGLDEIRAFGAGQHQVARRLRALLDTLLIELPEKRRPPLVAQRRCLTTPSHSPSPRTTATTLSSQTGKVSACHMVRGQIGNDRGRETRRAEPVSGMPGQRPLAPILTYRRQSSVPGGQGSDARRTVSVRRRRPVRARR
ncbi:MAG TPA: DUF2254 family protein [Streptosporangiaceae bacterium]|nr:DUF2254 family protein [Streptosporangiaceae bacterium]